MKIRRYFLTVGIANGISRVWAEGTTKKEAEQSAREMAFEYRKRRPDVREFSFKTEKREEREYPNEQ